MRPTNPAGKTSVAAGTARHSSTSSPTNSRIAPPSDTRDAAGTVSTVMIATTLLVDTRAAAAMLGRTANTLKRWRYEGVGPDYVVFQRRVRYDVNVLRDYIARNTRVASVRACSEVTRGDL